MLDNKLLLDNAILTINKYFYSRLSRFRGTTTERFTSHQLGVYTACKFSPDSLVDWVCVFFQFHKIFSVLCRGYLRERLCPTIEDKLS